MTYTIRAISGLMAACMAMSAGAAASAAAVSGVHGNVRLSPSCGGAQREGSACQAPYAGAQINLLADNGAVVASARTSPAGQFELNAPPGHYRLKVLSVAKLPRCPTPPVEIREHARTVVEIDCDSGMR